MNDGQVIFDITGSHTSLDASLNSATDSIAKKTAQWTAIAQTAVDGLMNLTRKAISGFGDLLKNGVSYNAQMQDYVTNFGTLLRSTEEAEKKITELKQYAVKTPFAMSDLAAATQTMLSFGLTGEETSLHLKRLGDISMGDAQKLQSLTLAFSQVSSTGKLMGQDLLQMINAGFNPLQVLAEKTGVSIGDLKAVMSGDKTSDDFNFRMLEAQKEVAELGVNASEGAIMLAKIGEEGAISADMVAAAMRLATSEGGLFFNALENASANFNAQWATMQDNLSTLTGNVFSGIFDKLSADVMPTVNRWLADLNDAYEKDGFTGLKGAAGGIFDEISTLAFNTGAVLITQLYNGLTGDKKTTEEIKAYLAEIFGAASDAVSGIKDAGLGVLEWIKENGELVGSAASAIGVGFGMMMLMTHPLVAVLAALAGAIVLLTTDWTTFEEKYPSLVATFENLTGLDFSTFANGLKSIKSNLSAFYNDALAPLFTWLSENGLAMAGILTAIGLAMISLGNPLGGFALIAGTVITHWNDITTAVTSAYTAVSDFLTQTVPEAWGTFVAGIKQSWQDNVYTPIDNAATSVLDFLGIKVPENWSMTKAIGDAWDELATKIDGVIKKVLDFFGLERNTQSAAGKYSVAKNDGISLGLDTSLLEDPSVLKDLFEDTEPAEIPVAVEAGAEAILQDALSSMDLTATVRLTTSGGLSGLRERIMVSLGAGGITGQTHASGGIFTGASRLLDQNGGLHTVGESGAEAVIPLDELWRRLGMILDSAFSMHMAELPTAVLPVPSTAMAPIPTSDTAGSPDFEYFAEDLAARFAEAIDGMTVEMDKRKVGQIVTPEVSRNINDEANRKKWTT